VDAGTGLVTASVNHFQCTDVDWSPCGRYVLSAATQPIEKGPNFRATIDNNYKLWTMQGKLLATYPIEELFQAMWRPRPPSLLPKEQREEKYLRSRGWWEKFAAHDKAIRDQFLSEMDAERKKLRDDWLAIRAQHMTDYREEAGLRKDLRGAESDEEEDLETVELVVEEEVSRKEEVVSNKEFIAGLQAQKAEKAERKAAGGSISSSAALSYGINRKDSGKEKDDKASVSAGADSKGKFRAVNARLRPKARTMTIIYGDEKTCQRVLRAANLRAAPADKKGKPMVESVGVAVVAVDELVGNVQIARDEQWRSVRKPLNAYCRVLHPSFNKDNTKDEPKRQVDAEDTVAVCVGIGAEAAAAAALDWLSEQEGAAVVMCVEPATPDAGYDTRDLSFPGGGGRNPNDATVELREELGLQLRAGAKLTPVVEDNWNGALRVYAVRAADLAAVD
jgi:hypothetical protein